MLMKRIILSLVVLAFAVSVQAGDAKAKQTKDAEKPACCSKTKVSKDDAAGCPFTKSACCDSKEGKKEAKKDCGKQQVLQSPKAAN